MLKKNLRLIATLSTVLLLSSNISESVFAMPTPPGGPSSDPSWSGATEITSAFTSTDANYSSTQADENAILINCSNTVTLNNPTVTKSGGTSASDEYSFYGINSAVMCKGGGTTNIIGGTVTTDAAGANGVFSYGANNGTTNAEGDGTTVNLSDLVITTTGNGSGGIMTTYGGTTNADNLTITTEGGSSAPIRTDRGGGWVNVDGGTYTSNGQGSPAIYSTADVDVSNAALVSNKSEGVCIEGTGSIELTDCDLTASNTTLNGNAKFYDTIMIYQSQSGDASDGTSSFTMTGGSLTSKKGHTFHVTNTSAKINLTDVDINNSDDNVLISVCDDGWSGASNEAVLTASDQKLEGDILVGEDSSLTVSLTNSSTFEGKTSGVITDGSGNSISDSIGTVNMTVDSGSTWKLTGDSYVTSLTNNGTIDTNGYTLYVSGTGYDGSGSGTTKVFAANEKIDLKDYFGTLSNVKYTSSDKKVAKVSKKGIVTCKKAGTVTISAIDKSSKSTVSSMSITVKIPSFSSKRIEIDSSSSVSCNLADYLNSEGVSESPVWISSKTSVAEVDKSTGLLTVKGKGNATIYAVYGADSLSDKNGSRKKYKIKIKVK